MSWEATLENGLRELAVDTPPDSKQRLVAFVQLLCKWNRVFNLTSVRRPADMVARHILDSLAVLPYLRGGRLLDVGTGAGLPGIPLAITRPDLEVTLLDSSAKKLRFVRQALGELALPNARAVHSRVEDYAPDVPFDTIIGRAFANLGELYEAVQGRSLSPTGRLYAMKGVYPLAEVEALPDPDQVEEVVALTIPGLAAQRHLVIMGPARQQQCRSGT